MKKFILMLAACAGPAITGPTFAGGSNYGIVPGALPQVQGKVTEWPVPTPKFARDPAPGPDGNIYVAVMAGNRADRQGACFAFRFDAGHVKESGGEG